MLRGTFLIPTFPNSFSFVFSLGLTTRLTRILTIGALLPGEVRKYGTTIAPGLYAPVHFMYSSGTSDQVINQYGSVRLSLLGSWKQSSLLLYLISPWFKMPLFLVIAIQISYR
ncbi:hypothetical protein SOVF_129760 [Spinacia oleracea]|nr:hypothetical protein SOVF_129760 [Spinacia oleracea]